MIKCKPNNCYNYVKLTKTVANGDVSKCQYVEGILWIFFQENPQLHGGVKVRIGTLLVNEVGVVKEETYL